jgi:hypothetical protein
MEWQLMAHACFHSNLPVATAYASLGKKGLSHALSQTESRALFTHASLFKTVLSPYLLTGGVCCVCCVCCVCVSCWICRLLTSEHFTRVQVLKSLKKCETLQYVFYVGEPDEQEMKELEQALTKRAQKAVDIETRVLTFDKLIKIVHARAPTPFSTTLI